MTGPHSIATPVGELVNRAHVREALHRAWPHQPPALLAVLTRAMTHPRSTSDLLLTLADALGEAAREASVAGQIVQHNGLTALRHILQDAAPSRADVPLQPSKRHSA